MEEGFSGLIVTCRRLWGLGAIVFVAAWSSRFTEPAASASDQVAPHASPPAIHVSEGKHTQYYHVLLNLRSQDFELTVPASERRPRYGSENRYELSEDGQFEIFVHKDAFPVSAPTCERYIIVRMPGTAPSSPDAAHKLARKRALFDALKELKTAGTGQQALAVELNPYVQVVSRTPLRLELTQCNAFLRQAHGAYIDHVGSLSQ